MAKKETDIQVLKKILIRAGALFGLTFFSTSVTGFELRKNLISSFFVAGLYFFTEMCKYYKVYLPNKKANLKFEHFLW